MTAPTTRSTHRTPRIRCARRAAPWAALVAACALAGTAGCASPAADAVSAAAQGARAPIYHFSLSGFQYGPGFMADPRAVAVGPGGDIYVLDPVNHRVQRFTPDGEVVAMWGREGLAEGELDVPRDIAVARDGTVYVAQVNVNRGGVAVFGPRGTYRGRIAAGSDELGAGALGVATGRDGRVCVTRFEAVECYDPDGSLRASWATPRRSGDVLYDYGPIAIDSEGHVYVLDLGGKRVGVYGPDGASLGDWTIPRTPTDGHRATESLAVHPDGSIHVGDTANGEVLRYGADGELLGTWAATADGLAFDAAGRAFAVEREANVVRRYGAQGALEATWGGLDPERAAFRSPEGLAFGPDGTLYVTDIDWSVVHHVDPLGRYLGRLGRDRWDEPGDLFQPYDVAVTNEGDVLVADFRNDRLVRYDSDGQLVAVRTDLGSPIGLALAPEGSAYALDWRAHQVVRFKPGGAVLGRWGSEGDQPGQMQDPTGIATGPDGSVWVADWGNDRVQRFGPEGDLLELWGRESTTFGIAFDGLANLTVQRDGSVVTVETFNKRLKRFTPTGVRAAPWTTQTWTTHAHATGSQPLSVAIDVAEGPDDKLYVADRTTGQVEVFGEDYAPGWYAQYFANPWLAGKMVDAAMLPTAEADWADGLPAPGVPADGFSARLFRHAHFEGGRYALHLATAGGARLWVDRRLVVDAYSADETDTTLELALAEGGHDLRLEYAHRRGPAGLRLTWTKIPGGAPTRTATLTAPTATATATGPASTPTPAATIPPRGRSWLPWTTVARR